MNNPEFFNLLDYVFLCVLFGSVFVGFVRGFTRDFFGTCAWIGSAIIATIMGPHVALNLQSSIPDPFVAKCAALVISFIVILVTLLMVISLFSRKVKDSFLSGIDRLFGSLFGFARGIGLLICVPILLLMFGMPQSRFDITRESKIATILYKIAEMLMPKISRATGMKPIKKKEPPKVQQPTAADFSKIPIKKKEEPKKVIQQPEGPDLIEQAKEYIDAVAERYLRKQEASQKQSVQQPEPTAPSEQSQRVNIKDGGHIYHSETRSDLPYERLNRRQRARYEVDKYRLVRPKYGIMNLMEAKERRLRRLRKEKLKEVIQKQILQGKE